MYEQRLLSSMISQSGISGSLADLLANDGSWMIAADNNTTTQVYAAFDNPTPIVSGTQVLGVQVRKTSGSGSGTPTLTVEIRENGATVATTNPVDVTGAQVNTFNFDASLITNFDDLEIVVTGTASGGSPSKRAAVDIGWVYWDVTYQEATPQVTINANNQLLYSVAVAAGLALTFNPSSASQTIAQVNPTQTAAYYANTTAASTTAAAITQAQTYQASSSAATIETIAQSHGLTYNANSQDLTTATEGLSQTIKSQELTLDTLAINQALTYTAKQAAATTATDQVYQSIIYPIGNDQLITQTSPITAPSAFNAKGYTLSAQTEKTALSISYTAKSSNLSSQAEKAAQAIGFNLGYSGLISNSYTVGQSLSYTAKDQAITLLADSITQQISQAQVIGLDEIMLTTINPVISVCYNVAGIELLTETMPIYEPQPIFRHAISAANKVGLGVVSKSRAIEVKCGKGLGCDPRNHT